MSQISVGGVPYGLRHELDRKAVPTVRSAPFDAEAVAREDAERAAKHLLESYGRVLPVNADLASTGLWTDLPNGDRLWRLRVASDGALATELYFEELFLPSGGTMHVYDDAGGQVLGGFTSANNAASGLFSTALIDGASCFVEYYEPQAVQGQGHFRITGVGHTYRSSSGLAAADACEVDVNCSEGADWTAQRDGVVRVGTREGNIIGWCSGALVNNVREDCRPFILTANHCGENSTATDLAQWKFYFKYERPGCGTGQALIGRSLTGCDLRGSSNDAGGDSGSDFLLLEARNDVPTAWGAYWCGWDATGTGSTGGKCIHHPMGSEKKISTYTGTTSSSSYGGAVPNTHWRVTWAATANGHGVTEGGSSGSPLFNSAHRIIGTLTGGSSSCTNVNGPDSYGKMSYHWQSDPGPVNQRLKYWLDPQGSGRLSMDGSYDPCGLTGISEQAAIAAPNVYPNPAAEDLTIELPRTGDRVERIDVRDLTGRLVKSVRVGTTERASLDVRGWSEGLYVIELISAKGPAGTARFAVTYP
ncbi:MAG: T9SS type A sorting domain-containing protein [Flavobacteriales bacterium]